MRDVAFIGAGMMGAPMAWRFVERGGRVRLLDPAPEATAPFRGQALVTVHEDVADLLSGVDTVLLSLPAPAALLDVGARMAAESSGGTVVINTSTTGPAAVREVAATLSAAGMSFVDAPVSGGAAGARQGTLTAIVSGLPDHIARCAPVFDVIAEHVVAVGPEPGQAQVVKLANNLLSLGALAITAEATALTSRAGVPLDVALGALNLGSGRNSATAVKFPQHVLTGSFDFGFPVVGALKDVALFSDLADRLDLPAPLAHAVVDCWRLAVERGYGEQDCTRIATMYEEMAGSPGGKGER
ncbi:NAD(P)-dependent oxidoreductase [Actinomadura mexicana]|uniref:3-hydroxyisobutyrate dehydrogenase n=1 Tax=Actinomadura mexicana TaxID=134959 RepID=A0A238XAN7_9ACTN|nr:NAD(P)-dependent oxidoreductase [Actinomadura mexicana]SNR56105.1 3-hydroxyisobutyrate dehydrogenase [Actinomadura mexicana]